jgi:uncharacterized protein (TIGR00730 family)
MKNICVYCGSSSGRRPEYTSAAVEMGKLIAERDFTLIYGAGNVGIMGSIADAALAAGGKVVGIIPKALEEKEVCHQQLTELHIVDSMHERKALMAEMADAFVALPGGLGTLEELIEALTWSQLGLHRKPCGLLNIGQYYQHLTAFIDNAVEEQFLKPVHRDMLLVSDNAQDLLSQLSQYKVPHVDKWISRHD